VQVIKNKIKITRVHLSGYKEENMDAKLFFCVGKKLDLRRFSSLV
jgi:hypothetical protein